MEGHMNTGGDSISARPDVRQCIKDCLECYQMCSEAIHSCLQSGGKHAGADHITLMESCAHMCVTAAEIMLLGSKAHVYSCQACAKICEMCADDCEEVGEMEECVKACRHCAESCERMAE